MKGLKLFILLFLYSLLLDAQDSSHFYIETNYRYHYYNYQYLKVFNQNLEITIKDITYPRLMGSVFLKNKIIVKTGLSFKKEFYNYTANGILMYSNTDTVWGYKYIYKDYKYICMPIIVGAEILNYKKNSIFIQLEVDANLFKKGLEQSSGFDGISSTSSVNNIRSWRFKPQILQEPILQLEYHRSIKHFYVSFITALSLCSPIQFDIGIGLGYKLK